MKWLIKRKHQLFYEQQKSLWYRFVQRLPLVSRKTVRELGDKHNKQLNEICREHDRELQEATRDIKEVVQRLAHVQVYRPDDQYQKFRLQVDLDEHFVHEAFIHGNDRMMLEYTARHVGHMVSQELRTLNFQRFRDRK